MSQQINVDITPTGEAYDIIRCSQADTGRAFKLNLYDGDSQYTIPNDVSLEICGKKSDKNLFAYSDNITIGTPRTSVTITLKEQMTACAGPVMCELRIKTASGIIGTCNFILMVEGGVLDGRISTSDIAIIAQVEAQLTRAETAASDAEDAATRAAASATAAANSATQAGSYESTVAGYADSAAASAQAASHSASNAAQSVTDAQGYANSASSSATAAANSASQAASIVSSIGTSVQDAQTAATEAGTKANAAADSATAAAASAAQAATAARVSVVEVDIPVSAWDSSTHLATITVQGVTTTSLQTIIPLLPSNGTNQAYNNALAKYMLYDAGQATDSITLYSTDTVTDALRVRVVIRGGAA